MPMPSNIPQLETERLLMVPPEDRHFAAYRTFYGDKDAAHFYGGPMREDQAWRQLAQDIGHWHTKGFGVWILLDRKTETILGATGLWWPSGWPQHELTWWLLPNARGHGYATEASQAAIQYGYDTLGWDTVETLMVDENLPAHRLAKRLCGTVVRRSAFPDGIDRDVYALPHPERAA